jgi:Tfp pilus assembly protein PilF
MHLLKWIFRSNRLVRLAIVLLVVGLAALGFMRRRNAALGAEHADRGRQALERGDEDAALAEYDQAVRLNPRSAEARLARARLLVRHGRPDEAVADWTAALASGPRDAACSSAAGRRILNAASTRTMQPISTMPAPTPRKP